LGKDPSLIEIQPRLRACGAQDCTLSSSCPFDATGLVATACPLEHEEMAVFSHHQGKCLISVLATKMNME